MKDFFQSLKFKILVGTAALLLGFMLFAASSDGAGELASGILGTITSPFQSLSSSISGKATSFFSRFANASEIEKENDKLKEENARLTKQMVDYQEILKQNKQLREITGVKELNDDFELEIAGIISRDPNEKFGSFSIDKGQLHGVKVNDPVMTEAGLVGRVYEVSFITSKVLPILSPEMNVSCYEIRTRNVGVLTGEIELFRQGLCKLKYLNNETAISIGDTIVTAGSSGLYPKELVVGKVMEVKGENHGKSAYAVIKPAVDINNIKDVIIIKSFLGQKKSDNDKSNPSSTSSGQ